MFETKLLKLWSKTVLKEESKRSYPNAGYSLNYSP